MQDFAGQIPADLAEADDVLTRYGRWASSRGSSARGCGSAERAYRAPGGESLEDRRAPLSVALTEKQRFAAQTALYGVPAVQRYVLIVLYVPTGRGVAHRMRILGVPARLSQERHIDGLRMWWDLYRVALTSGENRGRMPAT